MTTLLHAYVQVLEKTPASFACFFGEMAPFSMSITENQPVAIPQVSCHFCRQES